MQFLTQPVLDGWRTLFKPDDPIVLRVAGRSDSKPVSARVLARLPGDRYRVSVEGIEGEFEIGVEHVFRAGRAIAY